MKTLYRFSKFCGVKKECGATSVEYAIMASLIAGVIILAVAALGSSVNDLFRTLRWW